MNLFSKVLKSVIRETFLAEIFILVRKRIYYFVNKIGARSRKLFEPKRNANKFNIKYVILIFKPSTRHYWNVICFAYKLILHVILVMITQERCGNN